MKSKNLKTSLIAADVIKHQLLSNQSMNLSDHGDRAHTHHGTAPSLLVGHLDNICGAGVEKEIARTFSDVQFHL